MDLQNTVYRFFEHWANGIDEIFGVDNDNSDVPVPCPFYRDGYTGVVAYGTYVNINGYGYNAEGYAHLIINSNSDNFISEIIPVTEADFPTVTDADRQLLCTSVQDRFNQTGFNIGMDLATFGNPLFFDANRYNWLRTANSTYPFNLSYDNHNYYGTIKPEIRTNGFENPIDIDNLMQWVKNGFEITVSLDLDLPVAGGKLNNDDIQYINNNYYEYHNHYSEDGITVYYSDDFTFVTYEGDKSYNEVQNVVNNAYNNDNSVNIKVNAPSYETIKNGDKHPYYIAPLQPLQIPELGEMSLPAGDFGDAPKILAESVNEMTGLLDHLGLTTIFIVCALLVFILRKVRD